MNYMLYGFYYNGMTEESTYALMSLHQSKENAEKAMNEHKAQALVEYEEYKKRMMKEWGEDESGWTGEFGKWEDWTVWEVEVLP